MFDLDSMNNSGWQRQCLKQKLQLQVGSVADPGLFLPPGSGMNFLRIPDPADMFLVRFSQIILRILVLLFFIALFMYNRIRDENCWDPELKI
jgi:hypothetical protein